MAEPGDFSLIIEAVDKEQLTDAAVQFAAMFSLDATLAQQICKSAPIIFAQKLTKAEIKAITPRLTELSNAGLEFRITARGAGKIPKVNWPVRPQFTAGDSGGPLGLAFEWENNAFVCPNCSETYLFRRLGKLDLAATEPTPAPESASAPEPAPPVETVDTLREDLSSFKEEAPAEPEAAVEEAPSADLDMVPMDEIELQSEGDPGVADLSNEAAEALQGGDAPIAMAETSIDEGGGDFLEAAAEATAAPPAPVEEVDLDEPEPGEEVYNVFLSKITDTNKRKKATELIAKVKGCTAAEAKELTTRLVIPLAKNVKKKKAEKILASFKKLKIFGRMTKVK